MIGKLVVIVVYIAVQNVQRVHEIVSIKTAPLFSCKMDKLSNLVYVVNFGVLLWMKTVDSVPSMDDPWNCRVTPDQKAYADENLELYPMRNLLNIGGSALVMLVLHIILVTRKKHNVKPQPVVE